MSGLLTLSAGPPRSGSADIAPGPHGCHKDPQRQGSALPLSGVHQTGSTPPIDRDAHLPYHYGVVSLPP